MTRLHLGYRLLPGYLAAGNQIESVGANWEGPWAVAEGSNAPCMDVTGQQRSEMLHA